MGWNCKFGAFSIAEEELEVVECVMLEIPRYFRHDSNVKFSKIRRQLLQLPIETFAIARLNR